MKCQFSKKISFFRAVLYSCLYLVLLIANLFIRPYSANLASLDIKAGVDEDAVLAAFVINVILLLVASAILIYSASNRAIDKFLLLFIALNVLTLFYWNHYV